MQQEGAGAVELRRAGLLQVGDVAVQHLAAGLERLEEPLLLALHDAGDEFEVLSDLGISFHDAGDGRNDRVQERLFLTEILIAEPGSAAQDLSEHVAAAFVARQRAVGDREREGADVVGDDLQGGAGLATLGKMLAGVLLDGADDARENVVLEVVELALEDRREAFEAHAGIDVLLLERR
ncbi:MAG: hypothetical protein BWY66_02893 [bacterium ADurb.Bin374]|nr:MAG: hypothetical protein BWY66_02893 [bacterium ADurb.Bin374]